MNCKHKVVDGKAVVFDASWIGNLESSFHFSTYHQQASIVYRHINRVESILEIGTGNGLLYDLLKRRGWHVTSLDIDPDKKPDICDDAFSFNYACWNFDTVIAFEVFEHIPWPTMGKVLAKISQSSIRQIVFSAPRSEVELLNLSLKLPKLPALSIRLALPVGRVRTKTHFWELSMLSRKGNGPKYVLNPRTLAQEFQKFGFNLRRVSRCKYIDFFIAEKTEGMIRQWSSTN